MFRKISLFIFTAICSSLVATAQNIDNVADSTAPAKTRTLWSAVSPSIKTLGIYVSPEFQYVGAVGAYAPAAGLSGMFVINQRLAVGLSASHSRSFTPTELNNKGLHMNYGLGGAQLEYTIAPHSLVHLSIPLVLGAGMARVDSLRGGRRFDDLNQQPDHDPAKRFDRNNPFFVIQPGLRVEANLFRFAKLYVGANYRVVAGGSNVSYPSGSTVSTLSNSQLSGLNFNVGLKLGLFDYRMKCKARS